MDNCKTFERNMIISHVHNKKICVDATCGNGNDTLFLSEIFEKVFAFDIQKQAIENTKNICKDKQNIEYILDSHANIDQYVDRIDCAVFNLGYLPKGNKEITTKADTTIEAIKKTMKLLSKTGIISIMVYEGHFEGAREAEKLKEELPKINQKEFDIVKYEFVNQINSPPYLYLIQKR